MIARCGSHLQQRQAWVARLRAASEEADELDHDEEEEEDEDEENEEEEDPLSRSRSSSSLQGQNLTATIPDLLGSRSLGLDWGHKKIGVGLSAGFSQRPLGTIPNAGGINGDATKNRPTLDHILTLVRAEGAVRVVMGNPLFRYAGQGVALVDGSTVGGGRLSDLVVSTKHHTHAPATAP